MLPRIGGIYKFETATPQGVSANLLCDKFRDQNVTRERGGNVSIVPLFETTLDDTRYWLSLHQSWRDDPQPRSRQLVYRTTSLTVFFGRAESEEKVQLFRAEWVGVGAQRIEVSRGRFEEIYTFEAPGAGHPHWQYDAYQARAHQIEESRQRLKETSRVLNDIYDTKDLDEDIVKSLSDVDAAEHNTCMQRITRMHFASRADWAASPWDGDDTATYSHARFPIDTSEILNWVISTLIYIQRELNR
ncbi:MAG: hypothetical protein WKF74_01285 [Pyrinomonadaceae bacterium]